MAHEPRASVPGPPRLIPQDWGSRRPSRGKAVHGTVAQAAVPTRGLRLSVGLAQSACGWAAALGDVCGAQRPSSDAAWAGRRRSQGSAPSKHPGGPCRAREKHDHPSHLNSPRLLRLPLPALPAGWLSPVRREYFSRSPPRVHGHSHCLVTADFSVLRMQTFPIPCCPITTLPGS